MMAEKKLNENMTVKGAVINTAKIVNIGLIKSK